MRRLQVFALLLVLALPAGAQQTTGTLNGAYPGFTLGFHTGTDAASGISATSVVGQVGRQAGQGGRERFGIVINNAAASTPVIEILGDGNSVLRSISAGDLRGTSSDAGVKLVSSSTLLPGRYARFVYQVALRGKGSVNLVVKALLTGEPENPTMAHPLLVTYALSGAAGQRLALRASLPVEGSVEASPFGFIMAAKRSPAAVAVLVSPQPRSIDAAGNRVVIVGQPATLEGEGRETAMLWMRFDGAAGSTLADAQSQALNMLVTSKTAAAGPDIVVVSITDKANVNPNDTLAMTLICVNAGTQSASRVMLKNPVPQGTQYLTASAEGEEAEVSYERAAPVEGHGDGEVSVVRWTMNSDLRPGEDRVLRFKTVVR